MMDWLFLETSRYERRLRRREKIRRFRAAAYPVIAVALGIALILKLKGWL